MDDQVSDQGSGSFRSTVNSLVASDASDSYLNKMLKDIDPKLLSHICGGYSGYSSDYQDLSKGPLSLPSQNEPPKHVSEQQILEKNGIDNSDLIKSLSIEAAKELSDLRKTGLIRSEAILYSNSIMERLRHLSTTETDFSFDEAIEIADSASLLKILRRLEDNIEEAGQMANSSALLILQAEMMHEKGRELFARSKRMLRLANLNSHLASLKSHQDTSSTKTSSSN